MSGKEIKVYIFSICVSFFSIAASAKPTVHIRFFHSNCDECKKTEKFILSLSEKYGGILKIHDFDYTIPSNYLLLVELESVAKISLNAPVAVYVGSNYLYGAESILNNLEALVQKAKANNSGFLWRPSGASNCFVNTHNQKEEIKKRFQSFSVLIIALAGLIDGINPCAFATIILFVSLLSCYHSSLWDVFVTAFVFAIAVFITYFLIGIGVFAGLKTLQSFHFIKNIFDWLIILICLVLAALSMKDAYAVKRGNDIKKPILAMPEKLRNAISFLLREYTGRHRWLAGVFLVGVAVSLLETICTGQIYVPTLSFMIKQSECRMAALLMLGVYNLMFVLPLLILAISIAFGVKSAALLKWQSENAVAWRVLIAAFFVVLAGSMAVASLY